MGGAGCVGVLVSVGVNVLVGIKNGVKVSGGKTGVRDAPIVGDGALVSVSVGGRSGNVALGIREFVSVTSIGEASPEDVFIPIAKPVIANIKIAPVTSRAIIPFCDEDISCFFRGRGVVEVR